MPNTSTRTVHSDASPKRSKKPDVAPQIVRIPEASPKRPAADSLGGLNGLLAAKAENEAPESKQVGSPQIVRIPLERLFPDPDNEREEIDPKDPGIIEFAETLKSVGQLQPLLVRKRKDNENLFWIILGHRRRVALEVAGFTHADCILKDVTAAEWTLMRVIENDAREDLAPMEQARSYETAMKVAGLSQADLARKIGRSPAYISHRIRLLKLPDTIQQWISDGALSGTQGRELAVIADVPKAMAEFVVSAKRVILDSTSQLDEEDFAYAYTNAIDTGFRRMTPGYRGPQFKPTPEQLAQLNVRELTRYGEVEQFAANATLWDQLQKDAEKVIATKQSPGGKSAKASTKDGKPVVKTLSAAELKAQAEQAAAVLNKKVYRYYIAWLQDRLLECAGKLTSSDVLRFALAMATHHGNSCDRRDGFCAGVGAYRKSKVPSAGIGEMWEFCRKLSDQEIEGCVRQWFLVFLKQPAKTGATNGDPGGIETFAKILDVDVSTQWKCDRAFLDLHTIDQLRGLEQEWKLTPSTQSGKSALVDSLLKGSAGKPPPKSLAAVKPAHLD